MTASSSIAPRTSIALIALIAQQLPETFPAGSREVCSTARPMDRLHLDRSQTGEWREVVESAQPMPCGASIVTGAPIESHALVMAVVPDLRSGQRSEPHPAKSPAQQHTSRQLQLPKPNLHQPPGTLPNVPRGWSLSTRDLRAALQRSQTTFCVTGSARRIVAGVTGGCAAGSRPDRAERGVRETQSRSVARDAACAALPDHSLRARRDAQARP